MTTEEANKLLDIWFTTKLKEALMRQKWVRTRNVAEGREAEEALRDYTRYWDELPAKLREREQSMRPFHLEALVDTKLSDNLRAMIRLEIDHATQFIEEHKEYAEEVGA